MPKIPLVSIIGGGLSGLSLALSLSRDGIPSTIYENRDPSYYTSGALMLSPNALRILDGLGVYSQLVSRGYEFDAVVYKDAQHLTVDHYDFGVKEKHGYRALRVYRQVLLEQLRAEVAKHDAIKVIYGKKFTRIVSETSEEVEFEFAAGDRATSKILVGCDGIHSAVRRAAIEDISAKYVGLMAVTGAVATADIKWPTTNEPHNSRVPYPLPVQISESSGAFVMAPQNPDGSELLAGIQMPYPEQDRAGWDALIADKAQLKALLKKDYGAWSSFVQSAMDAIPSESMFIWPFNAMPRLKTWTSKGRRVIIIGDAAHAVPPTAGQGASQAFEDAFSLAALMKTVFAKVHNEAAAKWSEHLNVFAFELEKWQAYHQERVDKVLQLTATLNERRKPGWKPDGTSAASIDVSWLYNVDIEKDVIGLLG